VVFVDRIGRLFITCCSSCIHKKKSVILPPKCTSHGYITQTKPLRNAISPWLVNDIIFLHFTKSPWFGIRMYIVC